MTFSFVACVARLVDGEILVIVGGVVLKEERADALQSGEGRGWC
jgi:hypothetical protein